MYLYSTRHRTHNIMVAFGKIIIFFFYSMHRLYDNNNNVYRCTVYWRNNAAALVCCSRILHAAVVIIYVSISECREQYGHNINIYYNILHSYNT